MDLTNTQQSKSSASTYLIVPIVIFFTLLIFAVIRGPYLVSQTGIGGMIIVVAPLILATYSLTVIVMAGRAGVDLSIGPLIGFINVGMIQLIGAGYLESPISIFLYAIGVGIAYQILMALIIVFVRVQPIIVSLSGYLSLVGLNLIIMPRPSGLAPDWMYSWGAGTSIFSPVLVILIVATIGWYLLAQSAFWGNLKMMGSDERSTYTSGVNINMVRVGAHIIGGIYVGLAAITFTSLISSGDPSQGTTYTLMAVTALVLGGANLAGGRGSAFGALLGSLNIFLLTFALSTFNFGKMQSFITDMSYGVMLVVSLLISIAIPMLQKRSRGLSPGVVFLGLGVIAVSIMTHVSMDRLGGIKRFARATQSVIEEGYSAGTIILFMVIGVALGAYILKILFKHISKPVIALLAVLILIGFGLIFNPDVAKNTASQISSQVTTGVDYYAMSVFGLEALSGSTETHFLNTTISSSIYVFIGIIGTIMLSSVMILMTLPGIKTQTRRLAVTYLVGVTAVIAIGAIFFESSDKGYLYSSFSIEIISIILIGSLLFTITLPLMQAKISNINNLLIGLLCALALITVYFFASNSSSPIEVLAGATTYADQVFVTGKETISTKMLEYATPVRIGVESGGLSLLTDIAFCAIAVVLLQIFLRIAMGGISFKRFWKYWHIPFFAIITLGSLFYAVGIPMWQIIIVILATIITAPNVMHIISTYLVGEHKDDAIEKWQG
jgi:ribose transport system permease protein